MLFLKPEKFDQLKRDKKIFQEKNQIDGDGLAPIRPKRKNQQQHPDTKNKKSIKDMGLEES